MKTWTGLRQLSRDDLIGAYDREGKNVGVWSVSFIRDEIYQRDREAQGARMEQITAEMAGMTREMRPLTRWIAVVTLVNTLGVLVTLWRAWS